MEVSELTLVLSFVNCIVLFMIVVQHFAIVLTSAMLQSKKFRDIVLSGRYIALSCAIPVFLSMLALVKEGESFTGHGVLAVLPRILALMVMLTICLALNGLVSKILQSVLSPFSEQASRIAICISTALMLMLYVGQIMPL